MEIYVAAFADTHGGHRLGLMNPDVILYDEDEDGNRSAWHPELTATQRYMWRLYTGHISKVKAIAKGKPLVVLHVGDLTQGKKYANQLVSTSIAHQIQIAVANMQPWFSYSNINRFRLVTGTGSHEFLEGTATTLVCNQLGALYPSVDVDMLQHGLLTVDGRRVIDCAHHGPSAGIRKWTEGRQLRYYLRSLMMGDILYGKEPPQLVIRGHFHEFVRTTAFVKGEQYWESTIILLPSYCGMGEYGRQATGSKNRISNGMEVIHIVDGEIKEIHDLYEEHDLRTEETIE